MRKRAEEHVALGLLSWLYHRDLEATENFLADKFARKPEILKATSPPCRPAATTATPIEDFVVRYEVAQAPMPTGTYRNISGNPRCPTD